MLGQVSIRILDVASCLDVSEYDARSAPNFLEFLFPRRNVDLLNSFRPRYLSARGKTVNFGFNCSSVSVQSYPNTYAKIAKEEDIKGERWFNITYSYLLSAETEGNTALYFGVDASQQYIQPWPMLIRTTNSSEILRWDFDAVLNTLKYTVVPTSGLIAVTEIYVGENVEIKDVAGATYHTFDDRSNTLRVITENNNSTDITVTFENREAKSDVEVFLLVVVSFVAMILALAFLLTRARAKSKIRRHITK